MYIYPLLFGLWCDWAARCSAAGEAALGAGSAGSAAMAELAEIEAAHPGSRLLSLEQVLLCARLVTRAVL